MTHSGFTNGMLIVGGSVLTSLGLVTLIRRLVSHERLSPSNGLVGNLLSTVGTFYAVLLGLIVVDSLTRFQRAVDIVQTEANCLADIFLLAERLPDPQKTRMQRMCRDYAHHVVEEEWPMMSAGRVSLAARRKAVALFRSLGDFEPVSEGEKAVYPMLLDLIRQVWDNRRERIGTVETGIALVEWLALILGYFVTVTFIALYGIESRRFQYMSVTLTTLVIGLNLYMIHLYGYPFSGELSVSKQPFLLDIEIFDGVYDTPVTQALPPGPRPAS